MSDKKFLLEVEKTCRIAYDGQPWKPQVELYGGKEYVVPDDVDKQIAQRAVQLEYATVSELELDEGDDEFNVEEATRDQLKDYIRSIPELDETVNLNLGDEKLRQAILDYWESAE